LGRNHFDLHGSSEAFLGLINEIFAAKLLLWLAINEDEMKESFVNE
jgi:hypothetical protein